MQSVRVSRRWIVRRSVSRRGEFADERPASFDRTQRGGVASGAATLLVAATGFLAYAVYHDYWPAADRYDAILHSISGPVLMPAAEPSGNPAPDSSELAPPLSIDAAPPAAIAEPQTAATLPEPPARAATEPQPTALARPLPLPVAAPPASPAVHNACPAPVAAIGLCAAPSPPK